MQPVSEKPLAITDPFGLPAVKVPLEAFIEFHFWMTDQLERLDRLATHPLPPGDRRSMPQTNRLPAHRRR